jgi:hypothetical protein
MHNTNPALEPSSQVERLLLAYTPHLRLELQPIDPRDWTCYVALVKAAAVHWFNNLAYYIASASILKTRLGLGHFPAQEDEIMNNSPLLPPPCKRFKLRAEGDQWVT